MKKPYTKPAMVSEDVYETLASGCAMMVPDDPSCNGDLDPSGTLQNSA